MPSSIPPVRDQPVRIRVAPEEVTVVSWPLVQKPIASLIAVALALAASWLAARVTGQWVFGLVAALALATSMWPTWLPVRYYFSGSGVTRSVLGRRRVISWSAIRHYTARPTGLLLLPDAVVTPLSPLRGLSICTGRQHEQVLANVEYYLHGWAGGSQARRSRPSDAPTE